MSKEYIEAFKTIKIKCHPNNNPSPLVDSALEVVEQALQRLESIDNANPSEALECIDDIYRNGVFISGYDALGKQHTTNISPETNKSISEQCNTIKQALIKAQEQEKMIEEYDLKPYELREALLLYAMYKGEYKGNPLPTLKQAQEQEKVLEIIKKKNVNIASLKAYDLEEYNMVYENKLTQEEFELLKRYFEKNIQK